MPQEPQSGTPRMDAPIPSDVNLTFELTRRGRILELELNEANKRISTLEKECRQNNQAACLFDRDAALEELAHAKESLVAERLSAGELAKQNHKMKDNSKRALGWIDFDHINAAAKGVVSFAGDAARDLGYAIKLMQDNLEQPALSSLIVLSRAEVEKLPCGCKMSSVNWKCERCLLLERFTK